MLEISSCHTSIDKHSKITIKDLPREIIVRKSLVDNLFTAVVAFLGLFVIIFVIISDISSISVWTITLALFFIGFTAYSLKSLLDRDEQIRLDAYRLVFCDGTVIRWTEVKATYIEKRKFKIRSGLERTYLRIHKKSPSDLSKELAPMIFEITGLEYTTRELSHIIELYKNKARLD